jgi:hypothetical protein
LSRQKQCQHRRTLSWVNKLRRAPQRSRIDQVSLSLSRSIKSTSKGAVTSFTLRTLADQADATSPSRS